MFASGFFKRTLPIALGGALAATALSTATASASSGWWASSGGGAEGYYNHVNDRVTACDIKTDGYKAAVQILANDGRLLTTVTDSYNNGNCSWRTPTLFQGTHKIRVCVVKGNARPVKCSAAHTFSV
ncbi:hypothetical protein ACFWR9_08445 [Streptomyces sp. NPDC058534]|uniref:hypothetical protein n=1 Tax=Streptomyces sp. NPDC058534 TaxID=3346541 RepID=UPI00364E735F